MELDTTTERRKPVSPWLSVPILQLVSRKQESICPTAQGTTPGPEGKEWRKEIRDASQRRGWGMWLESGRTGAGWTWSIRLRSGLTTIKVRLGASGSYSGEQFEGITENR